MTGAIGCGWGVGRLEEGESGHPSNPPTLYILLLILLLYRAYIKALGCCTAMRQACVERIRASPFNAFLIAVKERSVWGRMGEIIGPSLFWVPTARWLVYREQHFLHST